MKIKYLLVSLLLGSIVVFSGCIGNQGQETTVPTEGGVTTAVTTAETTESIVLGETITTGQMPMPPIDTTVREDLLVPTTTPKPTTTTPSTTTQATSTPTTKATTTPTTQASSTPTTQATTPTTQATTPTTQATTPTTQATTPSTTQATTTPTTTAPPTPAPIPTVPKETEWYEDPVNQPKFKDGMQDWYINNDTLQYFEMDNTGLTWIWDPNTSEWIWEFYQSVRVPGTTPANYPW